MNTLSLISISICHLMDGAVIRNEDDFGVLRDDGN